MRRRKSKPSRTFALAASDRPTKYRSTARRFGAGTFRGSPCRLRPRLRRRSLRLADAGRADRGRLRHRADRLRAALGARPVPHADVVRAWLGPRDLLVRDRACRTCCGARRSRSPARIADRFGPVRVLCAGAILYAHRPCLDGQRDLDADARSFGRRADRLRPCRLLVPDGGRRARQARAGELARLRVRRRHRGRLVRPVPVFAAGACADRSVLLADRAAGLRRHDAAGAAAVAGAGDAAGRRRVAGAPSRSRASRR